MSQAKATRIHRLLDYAFENSVVLIAGALTGLLWANLDPAAYQEITDFRLPMTSWLNLHESHGISLYYLTNDILMAFFFALAGKEVWEAMLPGGSLRNPRQAATPIICAVGGMAGPAVIYLAGAGMLGQISSLASGWAVPCATDIAFSYMVAKAIFGKLHPATPFLLLLAIADDALGLLVLAIFYPAKPIMPFWLLLPAAAVLLGFGMRRLRFKSFWWYLAAPGTISWLGFAMSGLHPALGLLPIIPTLPHARTGEAQVHWEPSRRHDALDAFEAWWKRPVEMILGLFGLMNAGVVLSSVGTATLLVLVALVVGKPIGIFLSGLLSVGLLRMRLPGSLRWADLAVVGCIAGIGFTVALFVTTVAFPAGPLQDSAKMGALASFVAAVTGAAGARLLRVGKFSRRGPLLRDLPNDKARQ